MNKRGHPQAFLFFSWISNGAKCRIQQIARPIKAIAAFACLAALTGCSLLPFAQPTPAPSPSPLPSATLTPTATIVWFPATSTPTRAPTVQASPTGEMRPYLGQSIFIDNFTNTTLWSTVESDAGRVVYGDGSLNLSISQVKGALTSFRSAPELDDFYLEITASPSLCRGADSYGVIFRAASVQDFYRFMLNCSGKLRLERYHNGQGALLQDWVASGQVRAGAPMTLRLGVWALGKDLRFFVDDVFQFSVSDPVLTMGRFGVYAIAAADPPLTVSFTKMSVRAVK